MKNKKFQLFSSCSPIKGINNGIIIDFARKSIFSVSNQIIDILYEYQNKNIIELFCDYEESKQTLKQAIRYFVRNELVQISDSIIEYPSISKDFIKSNEIDVVTIETSAIEPFLKKFIINEINQLGVISLKLIIKGDIVKNVEDILSLLSDSKVISVTLFMSYNDGKNVVANLAEIMKRYQRVIEIIFYECQKNVTDDEKPLNFYYEKFSIGEVLYKPILSIDNFILHRDAYNEAQNYNFIYNKTVFIDVLGNVKNHINDEIIYGNLKELQLKDIVKKQNFKQFWNINRDQIEVCKDCKFRHICPDGRISFKKSPTDLYYQHKTNCNYNPYQDVWKS